MVTTVLEKKNDCPKLHDGTLVPFLKMDTPRLLASTMAPMKSSRASSEREGKIVSILFQSEVNSDLKY